jgi:hypothetical protein
MIAKGKSISHGTAALEYDLAKEINGRQQPPRYTAMSFSAAQAKKWCRR